MEHIKAIQFAACGAFVIGALILLAAHWFPSMRGPNWTGDELTAAIVFALLAIAVRS